MLVTVIVKVRNGLGSRLSVLFNKRRRVYCALFAVFDVSCKANAQFIQRQSCVVTVLTLRRWFVQWEEYKANGTIFVQKTNLINRALHSRRRMLETLDICKLKSEKKIIVKRLKNSFGIAALIAPTHFAVEARKFHKKGEKCSGPVASQLAFASL
ncbi:hypothetical protein T01_10256 [Trichinella spiralis]|uniref:Uncharacterized protein n=1 Tax=Trichinella spiralis TaxID=6334 RepID=A0A0V1BMV4_TRISP|nr:hypothetical protein T01_10256 [Trichinella spiralis]